MEKRALPGPALGSPTVSRASPTSLLEEQIQRQEIVRGKPAAQSPRGQHCPLWGPTFNPYPAWRDTHRLFRILQGVETGKQRASGP